MSVSVCFSLRFIDLICVEIKLLLMLLMLSNFSNDYAIWLFIQLTSQATIHWKCDSVGVLFGFFVVVYNLIKIKINYTIHTLRMKNCRFTKKKMLSIANWQMNRPLEIPFAKKANLLICLKLLLYIECETKWRNRSKCALAMCVVICLNYHNPETIAYYPLLPAFRWLDTLAA